MRTLYTNVILVLSLACFSCHSKQQLVPFDEMLPQRDAVGEYSPTTLIITYDAEVGKQPLLDAIKASGAQIIYDYKMIHGMAIKKPDNMTLDEAIAHFRKVRGVLTVEKDRIIRLTDPVKPPVLDR